VKRVLITGGAGFIGHHVVQAILERTDWSITLIDRLDCSGNLDRLAEIGAAKNPRIRFIFHDLRAPFNDQKCAQIGQQDFIIHLAAGTHVDRSIECPMDFVQDNVVGTCNILDFARKMKCERFLQFSTDEVFGPAPAGTEYREDDRYNSGNPYAATKAGAEELAVAYANTYGLPVIITHTMNVIGERQHPEKFVPMCIAKIAAGETISIHSDQTKTIPGSRFYIHAADVAEAVLILLQNRARGKFNIVGEREVNNLDLAKMIAREIGAVLKWDMVDFHSSRPGHDLRYALNGKKMLLTYGWRPQEPIEHRVRQLVAWTLKNPHWLVALSKDIAA
jgi:dTDP-glucose 4,6-dehydratase